MLKIAQIVRNKLFGRPFEWILAELEKSHCVLTGSRLFFGETDRDWDFIGRYIPHSVRGLGWYPVYRGYNFDPYIRNTYRLIVPPYSDRDQIDIQLYEKKDWEKRVKIDEFIMSRPLEEREVLLRKDLQNPFGQTDLFSSLVMCNDIKLKWEAALSKHVMKRLKC